MTEVLDISETVTVQEYRRVLDSLLTQFENWRNEKGWCTDLYLYVGKLSRTFSWDPDARGVYPGYSGEMSIKFSDDRSGEEMAADLRDIRGRILKFTVNMPDALSVAKADEFLTLAGLAPHSRPESTQIDYEFSGRLTTKLTATEVKEKIAEFLAGLGANTAYGSYTSTVRGDRVSPDEMVTLL